MSTLPPSFRLPPSLEGKADPEVVEAIHFHDDAITDLQQAIPSLKSQIDALKPSTTTTAATTQIVSSGGGSNTIISSSTIGMVNDQTGNTAYSTLQSDYGAFIILNDSSAITITLSQSTMITLPWYAIFINEGAGLATLTPATGTISYAANLAAASLPLPQNVAAIVVYDGTNFTAVLLPISPANTPATPGKYLTGYNSTTGAFSVSTPAGISVTITTAALTGGGTQGSMTFTGGILTAQVQAT